MLSTMNPGAEGSVGGHERTVYVFLVLRMIVAALVVGAGVTIIQLTHEAFPVRPLYTLLALVVVTGAAAYGGFKAGLRFGVGLWALMIVDIVIEGSIVHYSGGIASQFSMIYCLTIVAAAFLLEMPGGLTTAILASSLYILYGIIEMVGWVTPPASHVVASQTRNFGVLEAYMHVSLFFLVGVVGGFLARRIQTKGRLLETAKSELHQLRVDTDYILKNMSSGILVIDTDGNVVTMNPVAGEILGVDADGALGRGADELLRERSSDLVDELFEALGAAEGKKRHEVTVTSPEGKETPLGTSISIVRDPGGNVRGAISVFQDLTEVQEMRNQVRKADRLAAIGELSAGIAHELRNPLASISGSIEMLAAELELEGENQRLMELITRESDRLDAIISDFLDFARIRFPARLPMPLGKCIDEVLLLLKNNPGKSEGVDIRLDIEPSLPPVRADDEQLRQVFMNIAVNSCEAMAGKGRLQVVVTAVDDRVQVSFQDDGPGIDAAKVAQLFEPFFTTKADGTGLGLAIANKIVTAHEGSIDFRNRPEGGAEFVVSLPTAVASLTRLENIASQESAETSPEHAQLTH